MMHAEIFNIKHYKSLEIKVITMVTPIGKHWVLATVFLIDFEDL